MVRPVPFRIADLSAEVPSGRISDRLPASRNRFPIPGNGLPFGAVGRSTQHPADR